MAHHAPVYSASISQDSCFIVSCSRDNTLIVWVLEPKTGFFKKHQVLEGHKHAVTGAEISFDNKYIVSSSMDNLVKVWLNVKDNFELVDTLNRHLDFVSTVSVSKHTYTFVSGSFGKSAILWYFNSETKKA